MKKFAILLLLVGAPLAFAQETSEAAPQVTPLPAQQTAHDNIFTSFASQFFEGDFVNYYAFFNGVYDTTQATLQGRRGGGGGFALGGGVTASKHFRTGQLSLAYRGDYRDYAAGYQGTGTDQYLSLVYAKQLSRHWGFTFSQSAGILFYNNAFYNTITSVGTIQTNPFSPTSRFLSSSVYMSYQQSRRLKYIVGGSFFLNRYNYPGAFGSTGGIGTASVTYSLTARTTIGGTYSHDNFYYQHNAGDTAIDGGYLSVSHIFGRAWNASVSGGITSARTAGTIDVPITLIIPGGQTVVGYAVSHYNVSSIIPTVSGSLSHSLRKFMLTASAGHGVTPGNGTYLTSSHTFFGGAISRRLSASSSLGVVYSYSRISSIANKISQSYAQSYFTVSYSRVVIPHVSLMGAYNYNRYGSLLSYSSAFDSRFIVGISFSSKSIPMTLF